MIAKVKSVKVGTHAIAGKLKRSFAPEMDDLIGQYVEVVRDAKHPDWYGMKQEFDGNKFVFHKNWIEIDRRRDVTAPIQLPTGKKIEIRTQGGIISDEGVTLIDTVIGQFNVRDDATNTRIEFPRYSSLVKRSVSWLTWNNGKPLDLRYREYVIDKYGVQVPDAICEAIAKTAKVNMSIQKPILAEISTDLGIVVLFIDKNSGEVLKSCDLREHFGWLIIDGGEYTPRQEVANAVAQMLGTGKYKYGTIKVDGMNNALCIFSTKERGPIATKLYKVGVK